MKRLLNNTVAVLLVTAATALGVFGTVQLSALASGSGSGSVATASGGYVATNVSDQGGAYTASSGGGSLVCPRTGCTAQSCHGARR
jgi:hypothetical protein